MYVGVRNPVEIIINGLKTKYIDIEIDNGKIFKIETFKYSVEPENIGLLTFKIYYKKKYICSRTFRVIEPVAVVSIIAPIDEESNLILSRSIGLDIHFNHLLNELDNPKLEYDIMIIRGEKVIFNYSSKERLFNEDIKNELKKIEKDDLIIFKNIKYIYRDSTTLINGLVLQN